MTVHGRRTSRTRRRRGLLRTSGQSKKTRSGVLGSLNPERANKAPEPTTMAVTIRAPSSTARASHGRGSS
jgi:hypothetical protein